MKTRFNRKSRKEKKNRKSRKTRKQRRQRGGSLHPASTVVYKPDDESPFLMTDLNTMKNVIEVDYRINSPNTV